MCHKINSFFKKFIISFVIAVSHLSIFFNSMPEYLASCGNVDSVGYDQKY